MHLISGAEFQRPPWASWLPPALHSTLNLSLPHCNNANTSRAGCALLSFLPVNFDPNCKSIDCAVSSSESQQKPALLEQHKRDGQARQANQSSNPRWLHSTVKCVLFQR